MTDLPLLTNSRLRTFRACPREHHLSYVEGWKPVREGEALRIGSLVHLGLEAWWRNQDGNALPDALDAVRGKAFDAYEQAKVEEMLVGYSRRWSLDRELYDVLAVEQEFRAPLLNPETWAASKTWQLAGKVDVIVRLRSDGRVLVVDHKSCSEEMQGDDATLWAKLAMDSQPSQYVLGAEALGYTVDELLWDVLKKPAQRPKKATPIEDRKFTKDGALYKTQREFDEAPDEYRARVAETLSEAPDRFFQRRSFPRSNSQIQEHMADAWMQSATMRESARLGRAPRNPESCHNMRVCPYWNLCSTGGKPEDYPADFVRVENVNSELGGTK